MASDAGFHVNDMATSSDGRRRAEAALVHALDANPDVADPATCAAVKAYVEALLADGHLPEAAVIAFKNTLARAESLHRFESEKREQVRAALVSECIERYFEARVTDDVHPSRAPGLRLVRDHETTPHGPEATT
jgi:formate-dependent nitrite reductase cytochrome c552 subunit